VFDAHGAVVSANQASILGVNLVFFRLSTPEVLDVEGIEQSEGRGVKRQVGIGVDLVESVPPEEGSGLTGGGQ